VRAEKSSVFDLVALQNRPARRIYVPSVPKVSAGRSITVGNGEGTAGARRHRSNLIPCRGEEQAPVHAKPARRLRGHVHREHRRRQISTKFSPAATMTKAQNEIRNPSPYREPNAGSDGFDASVEVQLVRS